LQSTRLNALLVLSPLMIFSSMPKPHLNKIGANHSSFPLPKRQRAPSSLKNASAIYVDRFSETDNGHHYRIVRSITIEQQALKG
jgi:hypothetical protein